MKIAYIMSRFPHLPETFILREMSELDKSGWDIRLYPLIFQKQDLIHDDAQNWLPRVKESHLFSAEVIKSNISMFIKNPRLYVNLLGRIVVENITSINFLLRGLLLFPKAVFFAYQMEKEGIHHIHAHYASHPALVAWIIHSLTGISYSVTVHAHDIFARTEMLKCKLESAKFIIAISEYNREYIANLVGEWVKEKTHVIHCGINPEYYTASQKYSPGGSSEKFEILSVGSLKKIKGQKYLVEACAILRDRNIPIHCRIIGMGKEYSDISRIIKEKNLEGIVEILGDKTEEEVARILPSAHCFVQPSLAEGLPVAVMEAFACELPLVATAISGTNEMISPNETGYPIRLAEMKILILLLGKVYRNSKDSNKCN